MKYLVFTDKKGAVTTVASDGLTITATDGELVREVDEHEFRAIEKKHKTARAKTDTVKKETKQGKK